MDLSVFNELINVRMEYFLEDYDTNKDGKVTKEEFMEVEGIENKEEYEKLVKDFQENVLFPQIDVDNDGVVTKDELRSYYTVSDKNYFKRCLYDIIGNYFNSQPDHKELDRASLEKLLADWKIESNNIKPISNAIFTFLDKDNDGIITTKEINDFMWEGLRR